MKIFKRTIKALLILTAALIIIWSFDDMSLSAHNSNKHQPANKPSTQALPSAPASPTHLSASNISDGIELSWSQVKNAKGYYIYRGKELVKTIYHSDITKYIDRDSTLNGRRYTYRVTSFIKKNGKIIESKKNIPLVQYYLSSTSIDSLLLNNFVGDVKWKVNRKCTGYEIQYSSDSDFIKHHSYRTRNTSFKTKKLSSEKDYYFRIRTFIKENKQYYYSPWNITCKVIAWNPNWKYAKNSQIHNASVVLYYTDCENKKDKIVCVNAGHGTNGGELKKTLCHPDGSAKVTGGTTSSGSTYSPSISGGMSFADGTPEKTANLNVAKALKPKLLEAGYNVIMIRENDDTQLDNIARTVIANNNADFHIALHYDSTSSNKGAFFTGVPNIASYKKMEPVASNWKKHEQLGQSLIKGLRKYGIKIFSNGRMAVDLTQTSYSTISSVAIEIGDKRSDRSKDTIDKIANGLLYGILNY